MIKVTSTKNKSWADEAVELSLDGTPFLLVYFCCLSLIPRQVYIAVKPLPALDEKPFRFLRALRREAPEFLRGWQATAYVYPHDILGRRFAEGLGFSPVDYGPYETLQYEGEF